MAPSRDPTRGVLQILFFGVFFYLPFHLYLVRHDLNFQRIDIVLETISFFLVAPEFLGTARLESFAIGAEKRLSGPLLKVQNYALNLKKSMNGMGIGDFGWLVVIEAAIIGSGIFVFSYKWSLEAGILWWFVYSLLGILGLICAIIIIFEVIPYMVASSLNGLLSAILQGLAKNDRLRWWIFLLGTEYFFASKLSAFLLASR